MVLGIENKVNAAVMILFIWICLIQILKQIFPYRFYVLVAINLDIVLFLMKLAIVFLQRRK